MHQSIHSGMALLDVESLLTGRYYCFYQIIVNDGWKQVSREEFVKASTRQTNDTPVSRRLHLIFMGTSPRRTSFFVEIDSAGNVSELTNPYGWD
ncbi:hypothetical protein ACFL1X_13370 [Candidatus Hydrogenedentota bacterium]